ncbi:MAG: hypothetical protein ABSE55_16520 [Terracidiphilus sp.]
MSRFAFLRDLIRSSALAPRWSGDPRGAVWGAEPDDGGPVLAVM